MVRAKFNSAWLSLDPIDPFFDTTPQFLIRYMGYLCAPGFLMMNGRLPNTNNVNTRSRILYPGWTSSLLV